MHTLVVHGGAGRWSPERLDAALSGLDTAAQRGRERLAEGAPALDAVVTAVEGLEDDPLFNAGTGASLTLDGRAELDAGVMAGPRLETGSVAGLEGIRNPVRVARAVMETTDHVLLAGSGANRFARALGFPESDPVTEAARERWERLRRELETGQRGSSTLRELLRSHPDLGGGTVGAVALDAAGGLAAATSTGGTMLQLPGRVGDSPLPGAGNYADGHCAVSATGNGELMIRFGTGRAVAERIRAGWTAQSAVTGVLSAMREEVGDEAGLIAVDHGGGIGIDQLTPAMPHGAVSGSGPVAVHRRRPSPDHPE